MAIERVNELPKYTQVPSDKRNVKKYEQGELIKEVSNTEKTWTDKTTGKIVARGPLDKDIFERQQPVDPEGEIINKNGIINN